MLLVCIIGLLMTALTIAVVARRVGFLYRLATVGQPAPERIEYARANIGTEIKVQLVEVFGQKKLLGWTPSGVAHFFVMWAFFILLTVYVEAYGAMIQGAITGRPDFHIPLIGRWAVLGFLQDFIALAALIGLIAFAVIRIKNAPSKLGRDSRFSGSHLGGAWLILFMIFNIIWSLFLFRGAAINTGNFLPVGRVRLRAGGADPADLLAAGGDRAAAAHRPDAGVRGDRGEQQAPAHLHRPAERAVLAAARRHGRGPGDAQRRQGPRLRGGRPRRPTSSAAARSRRPPGRASSTSTPAPSAAAASRSARPGTPTSRCRPKMLILDQRDHAFADRALPADGERGAARPAPVRTCWPCREKPLVGERGGVIHPDVLWSCTNCGRLRRAVPGRHRARRPHPRHAPLPGHDRVELPVRGRRDAEEPRRTRATRGACPR